ASVRPTIGPSSHRLWWTCRWIVVSRLRWCWLDDRPDDKLELGAALVWPRARDDGSRATSAFRLLHAARARAGDGPAGGGRLAGNRTAMGRPRTAHDRPRVRHW